MLPVTSFLSCTEPIDQLACFSTRQKHHSKTYVTGLVAASNKTVQGISNHVLPAKSERALNKFLTEYDWDEDQLNKERLALLQQANDTKWSSEGVVIIDDTFTHKTGEQIPNVGKFYDHTVPGYIWGQNLIYALYADEKTTYPLGFRLYEKDAQRRIELAIELVDELIEIGVPADTYLFDMSYCSEEFVSHLETHSKEWVSAVKSDARVVYGGERIRVDVLCQRIDTVPRTIDGETYHIWTQKRDVSRLGEVKLLITKKESRNEGEEPSVKYIVSNKIDAPASHLIELYAMRWRVETFFRDTKQDLGFGDCELRHVAGASGDWHLLMLAYSLLKLGAAHSAVGTILERATSLRNDIKRSFRESVHNLLSWALNSPNRSTDDLMHQIEGMFV
ncbi:IS701 family transposase [Halostagnicola sp. A-GB9-2]|uniref:IS701 family transposase n=1 Tax=Halostagnicola sp. A-GB9-2 TaxID=3048066 RepID=UPI0024BFF3BB|nr:IS701 family transposase [Halostagnicola sp. A-GB9-2]MDJ1433797.1 IS701 family transposase [Halostagnicola sp. A-GB9-2]